MTDECGILSKTIRETWPDAKHALGKEHLIARFRAKGQELHVPPRQLDRMKTEVFGPGISDNLLSAKTREEFYLRFGRLQSRWQQQGDCAAMFAEWIEVNMVKSLIP